MSENAITLGSAGEPSTTENVGGLGRKTGDLDSFKSPAGTDGSSPRGGSPPSGKKDRAKNRGGRPPKNLAGLSAAKIDEVVDDPEIEAARAEFEGVLVELLVSTTDGLADSRFEILKAKFPEEVARGMADKARLTDKEKKYFGGVAVRLWRKYLGDKYLFTDEGIAGVYLLQYGLRNAEGISQARKIKKEINGTKDDQRPGLPSPAGADLGHERNGKIDPSGPADLQPPGPARVNL